MTTVQRAVHGNVHAPLPARAALLGCGRVGSAVIALAGQDDVAPSVTIIGALVRHAQGRTGPGAVRLTSDPAKLLADRPDVVIEALGGIERARAVVLAALERGIPVVTANKTLIAYCGRELADAARAGGTSLRYEASVLAGVPFLGTFAARPLASRISGFSGIVNGTTNYILSRMSSDGMDFDTALAEAQAHGYAEPDPAKDVNGIDAAEKLCVLLQHLGGWDVTPAGIQAAGISGVTPADLESARRAGGAIRPLVRAQWDDGSLSAFAGPAFVPNDDPLSRVDGVLNAIQLETRYTGSLFFSGPGAGPVATAATLLDDAIEAVRGTSHGANRRSLDARA